MEIKRPPNYRTRTALIIRAVRSAIGYNQEQFADFIGCSKPTIARLETLETQMSDRLYKRMRMALKMHGITIDALAEDGVSVLFDEGAISLLQEQLQDEARRRSDRQKR